MCLPTSNDPIYDSVAYEISFERQRSIQKHGKHAQDLLPEGDPNLFYNLVEEIGEVAHNLTYDSGEGKAALRKELIQVAAMAVAWIHVLDSE